jgi:hypothetical protein
MGKAMKDGDDNSREIHTMRAFSGNSLKIIKHKLRTTASERK